MDCFLAYFDLLGYKKFILNNNAAQLKTRTGHFARNIELSLSLGQTYRGPNTGNLIPDLRRSTLNTLSFSDTVVFWTQGITLQDFKEIYEVCFRYNHFNIVYDFPSRGCLVKGDIEFNNLGLQNPSGGRYLLNMIYGQALIEAHGKAENMEWAGCVLDYSALNYAMQIGLNTTDRDLWAMLYSVPYKIPCPIGQEYVFKLVTGGTLNATALANTTSSIQNSFIQDNKGPLAGTVQQKFNNTISFLASH